VGADEIVHGELKIDQWLISFTGISIDEIKGHKIFSIDRVKLRRVKEQKSFV
jgi:hypothetical protein